MVAHRNQQQSAQRDTRDFCIQGTTIQQTMVRKLRLCVPKPHAKPCPRYSPIPLHRANRHAQGVSGFLQRKPCEESEFHDARLPGAKTAQLSEDGVELEHVHSFLAELRDADLIELKSSESFPAFLCPLVARVIDQDPSDHLGCNRQETGFFVVQRWRLGGDSEKRFMDQRRWLKGVVRTFLSEMVTS